MSAIFHQLKYFTRSSGVSSKRGYFSKTSVIERCDDLTHCCLAFAVLLIPLRITALSEAGFAYKQSIRSFSTSASPSSDGASSPVSPLGRSHPTEQMQQRYCQSHNNGTMANNCEDIMANRNFKVRLGSHLSDSFNQEMGVPQGCILSVTLFVLKINNIVNCLPLDVRCSLYVDDFLICFGSKSIRSIERQLQRCVNNIESWADENGFQFSKSKTVCMHFCQKYHAHPDPELQLYGTNIPVVKETKFLGLVFDSKLSFIPHVQYLKDKCLKAMNLLRVVAHTNWGADSATLLKLYRSHIRSKLDYGCVVYGSARKSYLNALNTIQNSALRICLGAYSFRVRNSTI
jgi:hypothetical protein